MRVRLLRPEILMALVFASGCSCGDDEQGAIDAAGGGGVDADPTLPDADPTLPDADPTLPDADPTLPDADPTLPDAAVGVSCGTETCMGTEVCCSTFAMGMTTQTCTEPGDCQGSASSCDGPEDCGMDEICCGGFTGGADCQSGSQACQFELCHTATDCSDPAHICCTFQGTSFCADASFCVGMQ
jgi:hypothetical protein